MIPIRDHRPSGSFPFFTYLIIIANVLVFGYMITLSGVAVRQFIPDHSLVLNNFQIEDLVTFQFLHGGLFHILSNMLFLYIFGDNLEHQLGHFRFLGFYLACGIASGLFQILITPGLETPLLGASGAVAGVMGGYLLLFPDAKVDILVPLFIFFHILTVPAFVMIIYWIIIQFSRGLASLGMIGMGGVAYFAHIGGFLTGIFLTKVLRPRES